MTALVDAMSAHPEATLATGGLVIGFAFGALTLKTNFCTMGALSDAATFGDWRRFRAWMLAIAVAMAGAQVLAATGIADLAKSMYLTPSLGWAGNLAGGAMLGFGMVFAGGCPSRNLARAGSGDLRALLTLVVIGIFAFIAIGGLLGPLRAALEAATSFDLAAIAVPTQGLGTVLAAATGLEALARPPLPGLAIAGALLVYCLADRGFRASPQHMLSGVGVGLCVTAGWALTGLAYDDMSVKPMAPVSLTFVRPAGDTLEWLQRSTALGLPGFGVASLLGALAGAFVTGLALGRLRLQTFADTSDTLRCLGGGALMGIGGVLALGCSIGQGITGLSTLALGSFLAFAGILAGGFSALRVMQRMA